MRQCGPKKKKKKKRFQPWGSVAGLKTHILDQICNFTPFFVKFGAAMYIFEVKESIFSGIVKISLSILIKKAVLCQI